MRTLGFLLLLCIIVFVGLGFYFHWFTFSTSSGPNRSSFEVNVDRDKMRHDLNQAKKNAGELGHQAKQKTEATDQDK